MKVWIVGLLAALGVYAAAAVAAGPPPDSSKSLRQRVVERFDKDGDRKLSPTERAELRKAFERRGESEDQRQPLRMTWQVAGLERESLVYLPAKPSTSTAPVVFGFHGHGGTARSSARRFGFQRLWPEAMVVYMQGVPTPGPLTDPQGKRSGWQHAVGDHNDRDLKFFDAVLAGLREKYQVDNHRIYATGHSNGGGFTYLLWASRPGVFAAIAPSAAGSRSLRTATPKPVPVMHIAGRQDKLVRFDWQQRTMRTVRSINHCGTEGTEGTPWAKDCTLYASEQGAPFIAFIHSGTHAYPTEAPPLIVRFFKEQVRTD